MTDYLQQQFGDYRLVRLIGSGGFADVYEGEHLYIPGFKAAIKVLKGSFTPQQVGELGKEAHAWGDLDHPHIVRLHTFSIERGILYLVMSYAQGGSLDKRHPQGTRLTVSEILSYVRPVAQALQYAHDRRIMHQDLKPANLLLTEDRCVQVADFGIAVVVNSGSISRTMQEVVGTWAYMAPEQFQGRAEPASDQYSLAIMVYQWLCGEPPFTGKGNIDVLPHQHMNELPSSLCERVPTIESRVEEIVMRALAKEPSERFASVQAFVQELEKACAESVTDKTMLTDEQRINAVAKYPDGTRENPQEYRARQDASSSTAAKSTQRAKRYCKYAAYMMAYDHGILFIEEYQKMHIILKDVSNYWLHFLKDKVTSEIYEAEYNLVYYLWYEELSGPKARTASRKVAEYLVDDYLISMEVGRLIKEYQSLEEYFNMSKRLDQLLEDMQNFMGKKEFQSFYRSSSIYQEADVQTALCVMMRRYVFALYLDKGRGKNIQKWLVGERKQAQIKYFCD